MNQRSGVSGIIKTEALGEGVCLLRGQAEHAARDHIWRGWDLPEVKRILSLGMRGHFMLDPSFGCSVEAIAEETQFVLCELANGGYAVLLPLLDEDQRTVVRGAECGIEFISTGGPAARPVKELKIAVCAEADDPYLAVELAARAAVETMGRGRLRIDKAIPEWMEVLGWCTWEAYRESVDEAKVIASLENLVEQSGVPIGFMLLDDGWQDNDPKQFLLSMGVKEGAFTDGCLKTLVKAAKERFGIRFFGCWLTLFGELRGVDPESEGLHPLKRERVVEPNTDGDTFGVVLPEDVPSFHAQYMERMGSDGVELVKIDFQSGLHLMTYPHLGRAEAARLWQNSLQRAEAKYLGKGILNCMAMSSDQVYHTFESNVCRVSDDYFPERDRSHPPHLRQNLYTALWMGEFQWPDWDMFQSEHPWAEYHVLSRVLSGGPCYVSDPLGKSDANLLRRLVANDRNLLRCRGYAKPLREQLFVDPAKEGLPLMGYNHTGHGGVVGLFHMSPDADAPDSVGEISPDQVEGLAGDRFLVYSIHKGVLGVVDRHEKRQIRIRPRTGELIYFLPVVDGIAVIGLIDKWNPPAAINDWQRNNESQTLALRPGGQFGIYSERPVRLEIDGDEVTTECVEGLYVAETAGDQILQVALSPLR